MICRPTVRITIFCFITFAGSALPARAQRPAAWVVPDVVAQFNALTERADPMGFHIGESPNPSTCKHYQGMARIEGPDGTPYLIVTRSGNTPAVPGPDDPVCDDSPGETGDGSFLVVRMGSRDTHGERFRSNRQTKGARFDVTPPDPRDTVATWFRFQGDNGFPHYGHPGGMQAVGHMLAVAVEHPYESAPQTVVLFVNMADPMNPAITSRFSLEADLGEKAGLVALTPLADGHYLMMALGGSNEKLAFYRSTITDLASGDLSWVLVDTWVADPLSMSGTDIDYSCADGSVKALPFCLSADELLMGRNWPTTGPFNGNPHQTLQFLREGDINGALFLAGARGRILGDDFIDLYRVECDTPLCTAGEQIRLRHASTRHLFSEPNAGGERLANLAAASTFYVSPSGELLFYATEHDNDGPSGTVKAGEWRHRDMVRDGSPTTRPTLTVNGPFDIDEGSAGSVTATARQPVTKAWVQLFTGQQYEGLSVVVDYDDYVRDDYNFLLAFEFPFGYYGRTRSWRWFAPLFCNAAALADNPFDENDVPRMRTLAGFGGVLGNPDLSLITDDSGSTDMDERTSGVDFLEGCDTYYNTPFEIRWDRDGDGSFETAGGAIPFDAATLDGPVTFQIPVRSTHPVGGTPMNATATVTVRNVAPSLSGFRITDSAGRQIGVDVPFALVRTPVNVSASFTDPGRPDHQGAQVSWGDGVAENHPVFTSFADAFGGAIGTAAHSHRYAASGQRAVTLSVFDDDGGRADASVSIRVVTPEEAIADVVNLLAAAIAGATSPDVRTALLKAQRALLGNEGAEDGALRRLAVNQPDAAAAFIAQAIGWLESARALGASVDLPIILLQQVLDSLADA